MSNTTRLKNSNVTKPERRNNQIERNPYREKSGRESVATFFFLLRLGAALFDVFLPWASSVTSVLAAIPSASLYPVRVLPNAIGDISAVTPSVPLAARYHGVWNSGKKRT